MNILSKMYNSTVNMLAKPVNDILTTNLDAFTDTYKNELEKINKVIQSRMESAEEIKKDTERIKEVAKKIIRSNFDRRTNEVLWNEIIHNMTPLICVIDTKLNIIKGNNAFCNEYAGGCPYSKNDIPMVNLFNVLYLDENIKTYIQSLFGNEYNKFERTEEQNTFDYYDPTSEKYYILSISPLDNDNDKAVEYCVITLKDYTTQMKYMEETERLKSFYQSIIDEQLEHVFRFDRNLDLTFINKSAIRYIYGDKEIDRSDILGKNIVDVFSFDPHYLSGVLNKINNSNKQNSVFIDNNIIIRKGNCFYTFIQTCKVLYNCQPKFIEAQIVLQNKNLLSDFSTAF